MQCKDISRESHLLSVKPFMILMLWRWPSKTVILNTFICSKTKKKCIWYISRCGFTPCLVKCLCLCAIEHPLTDLISLHLALLYSSVLRFGPGAPGHSSTLSPCIYIHISLPPVSFLSLPVSSHCPSFLTFLQSQNRSNGNWRVIDDSPPASASLGRCLFASPCIVILSFSPVPAYLT